MEALCDFFERGGGGEGRKKVMEGLEEKQFEEVFLNFGVGGVEAVIRPSSSSSSPSSLMVSLRMSGESTSFEQWTGRISKTKLQEGFPKRALVREIAGVMLRMGKKHDQIRALVKGLLC